MLILAAMSEARQRQPRRNARLLENNKLHAMKNNGLCLHPPMQTPSPHSRSCAAAARCCPTEVDCSAFRFLPVAPRGAAARCLSKASSSEAASLHSSPPEPASSAPPSPSELSKSMVRQTRLSCLGKDDGTGLDGGTARRLGRVGRALGAASADSSALVACFARFTRACFASSARKSISTKRLTSYTPRRGNAHSTLSIPSNR